MNFLEIAQARQSCRSYDETKAVEKEKLDGGWKPSASPLLPATASPIT